MQECGEVFRAALAQMDLGANRVTVETMNQIREETSKDPVLAVLHKVVLSGWPTERKCPSKSELTGIQETRSQCMMESFTSLIKLSYPHPCDLKCYGRYTKLTKAQTAVYDEHANPCTGQVCKQQSGRLVYLAEFVPST